MGGGDGREMGGTKEDLGSKMKEDWKEGKEMGETKNEMIRKRERIGERWEGRRMR